MAIALLLSCTLVVGVGSDGWQGAEALYRAGKWAQARDAFEKALPTLSPAQRQEAFARIGYCWQRLHRHKQAIAVFQKVIASKDADPVVKATARLRLGYSLRLEQKFRDALEPLLHVADDKHASSDTKAQALLYAAWTYQSLDDTDNALKTFFRVENVKDVHQNYIASAYLNIGRVHQARGEYAQAVERFRKIGDLKVVASVNRARARVYRLECEALLAGDNPFHIRPYANGVTKNSAILRWVSQHVENPRAKIAGGKVLLRIDGADKSFPATLEAVPDTVCTLHTAQLTGLKPGTRYAYQVASEGKVATGSFKTAPTPEAPYSFCVIGDTQSYHQALQPMLDRMGQEKSDFVLHVGDITDRGNLWGEWKGCFFDPGHAYLSKMVLWPAYGNHDGGPYFPLLFSLQKQYYYSFDWGNTHFIVLDSYGAGTGGAGRARQIQWLKKDLQANKQRWTIVALHVPMVATRSSIQWFGEQDFLPILEEHEVDIVFSGHHPHYRRYWPIGREGKRPILHITSGGGGGPVGGYMPSPLLDRGIDLNHYCTVDVDGDSLTLTAKAINGADIDRFTLNKTTSFARDNKLGEVVSSKLARQITSVYQELITDRTHDFLLEIDGQPGPGEQATLTLELSRLPRGKLKTQALPKNARLHLRSTPKSPWQIQPQSFALADGKGNFAATAPAKLAVNGTSLVPSAEVTIQLEVGNQRFSAFTTTARIVRRKNP